MGLFMSAFALEMVCFQGRRLGVSRSGRLFMIAIRVSGLESFLC